MNVWVVVSDCGLNGLWVHGVYTSEPDSKEIHAFTDDRRVSGTTGYQYTEVLEFELDAELR